MSALLSESDLNDFISPGLACVKPAQTTKEHVSAENGGELEVGKESNELEKVSISLQDCLACAGCITSSEEILLSRQSHAVFLETWKQLLDTKALAVSIPPQCRLSLSHYYGISLAEFDLCFINLMRKHFGARYVVGTQLGRNITTNQTNDRLIERKKQEEGVKQPVLCAVCPGFVLYAEKTKPELVPLLLDVKSPQQITGALLKEVDNSIYHLTIMPCFDKKLEASRKDGESEVDCVITPREFVTMLQELKIDLKDFATKDTTIFHECSPQGWDPEVHWASNSGSSSGGYAYQYLVQLQKRHPGSQIISIEGKNSDIVEHRLMSAENEIVGSSSELYGFRNIQNMVRKLTAGAGNTAVKRNVKVLRKRNLTTKPRNATAADPYKTDFIEVMACPGGCINGGGLLNGEQNSTRRRALAQQLNDRYEQELVQIDIGSHTSGFPAPHHQKTYVYNFTPIEQSSDVVTVGNTW